ncbi:hypothetical protein C9446_17130 [Providencia heimbachae]|uniref:O-antigen ligase family protein n=1 Tax=Providencia heimbachae TaxID=333962 RepID=UPI0010BF5BAE|nr:O-antigen ligase family protein [Providencia heimbachae]QCJ71412.1 hypothetical protein C9446_17130 [Providencia heimbachae]
MIVKHGNGYNSWIVNLFVVIFLGVILHIYMPNLGGAGLSLPINIISCCSVALFIVVMSGSQLNKNNFHYSVASQWISIGLIILIVLCFLSPATYRYSAYLIAAWIVGALIFYCLLLQVNITEVGYEIILWSIIFSAIVESILAFLQVFDSLPLIRFSYPSLSGDRPYGIFQQVNVFSSFICIGVASALGLIIKLNNKSQNKKIMIGISLILMSSVLPLSQSLTGYLSLFLIVIAFFVFSKNNRKEITFLFLFVIIGLVIGYGIKIGLNISDVSETKLQTSHIRWVLWQHSLYLFSDHFFLGTGIGSFESVFLETYGGELMGIGRKTMSHPHNEILRWMVEGGIIGLIGILFIIIGGIHLSLSSIKNNNYIYLIIAFPIVFHIMTEFPLWLSTPHGVILMLLLRCADNPMKNYVFYKPLAIVLNSGIVIFGFCSMILLYMALQGQQYLTYIEKTGQQKIISMMKSDSNKWNYALIYDRYNYDLNMGNLLLYNENQDDNYLKSFDHWAEEYSKVYSDANVYFSWYLVLNELGEKEKAKEVHKKAKRFFVKDERF